MRYVLLRLHRGACVGAVESGVGLLTHRLPAQPKTLDCGHTYCSVCASNWFTGPSNLCPIGRCPGSNNPRLDQKGINFVIKAQIDELPVHCVNGLREARHGWKADPEGCPFTGTASEVDAHFDSCPFKLVACSFECGAELRPSEKAAHEAECGDTRVRCPFAGCGVMHKRRHAARHQKKAGENHARHEREKRQRLQSLLATGGAFLNTAREEIKQAIASKDTARIVDILDTFRQNADIARRACAALETVVGFDDAEQVKAGEAGAVVAVVDAMKVHAGSAVVQEQACSALVRITATNDDNTAKAGSAGAVEAVVAAMREHAGHVGVQEKGAHALFFMSGGDNTARMASAGAGEAVWAAVAAHPGSMAVLWKAAYVLRLMGRTSPVPADTVVKAVVEAMTLRLDDAAVQEAACDELLAMARDDAVSADVAASVIRAALAAMAAHPGGKVNLHQSACLLLGYMTQDAGNRAIALEAGAGEAVIASLKAHTDNKYLQEWACEALASIMPCSSKLLKKAAWEVVVAAMAARPGEADLQQEACAALTVIIAGANSKMKGSAMKAVLAAVDAHRDDADVQREALAALAAITAGADRKMQNSFAAGIGAAIAAMGAHGDDEAVQKQACAVVANLTMKNAANAVKAGGAGIDAALAAMKAHRRDGDVQEKACAALANLASGAKCDMKARFLAAMEAVQAAMKAHKDHPGVQKEAGAALVNICSAEQGHCQ